MLRTVTCRQTYAGESMKIQSLVSITGQMWKAIELEHLFLEEMAKTCPRVSHGFSK